MLNNKVIFQQPKLTIFDESRYINQFPDTIHIHYPYFIVVVPEDTKQITTIYSLKKQVASYNDIVLDYENGNYLYNYHGGNTYYKGKNLKVHCNLGFIKNSTDILCVIQNPDNPLFNNLISINPQTSSEKTLYSPQDAITAVYFENNSLYLGEYNYGIHQAYIIINGKSIKVDNFISIIYPFQNNMYVATLKNTKNNLSGSYSEIVNLNNEVVIKLIRYGLIRFY